MRTNRYAGMLILGLLLLSSLSANAHSTWTRIQRDDEKVENVAVREMKIKKNYLNFPITLSLGDDGRLPVSFILEKDTLYTVGIALTGEKEDYWTFKDVSAYKGKTLKLSVPEAHPGMSRIFQSDEIVGQDSLYHEKYRPQYHFSSRRGWMNDPNGLIWFEGEYHLFYQHSPFDTMYGNTHWGHAVSKDMLHWEELPDVLAPDELGRIYSGSSTVDVNNDAGFGKNTLLSFYTGAKKPYSQCMAYSHDHGRTYTKYEGNPILDNVKLTGRRECRDPKVFWYEPIQKWVMVLFEDTCFSIYNSTDLKHWEYQSKVDGFVECPELFSLPVDGNPNQIQWVMQGGSGAYMLGDFDGHRFTPKFGKYFPFTGARYAGQTFANHPDGRVIQMAWARDFKYPGMPFNQQMNLPVEFSLKTTKEGVRLFSNPIHEVESLHGKKYEFHHVKATEVNEALKNFDSDYIHMKLDVELLSTPQLIVEFRGTRIVEFNTIYTTLNGYPQQFADPGNLRMQLEIFVDTRSLEIFVDGGRQLISQEFETRDPEAGFLFYDEEHEYHNILIHSMELYEMNSVWD